MAVVGYSGIYQDGPASGGKGSLRFAAFIHTLREVRCLQIGLKDRHKVKPFTEHLRDGF